MYKMHLTSYRLSQLSKATEDDVQVLGQCMYAAKQVAVEQGLGESGFRVVINDGKEGEK